MDGPASRRTPPGQTRDKEPSALMPLPANLFAGVPRHLPEELTTPLLAAAGVRIERIVSHGHASPAGFWYDQDRPEWVMVLTGAARLRVGNELVEMTPGDWVHLPAHVKHRVEWTTPAEPTVWLAVHYGGRDAP
jgi:cupin 2 domain-containing protein